MNSTFKTSVSLKKENSEKLKKYDNKSDVINKALYLYFDKEEFLKTKEKEYWEYVNKSIKNGDQKYISLNPEGEEITKNTIKEKLWK